MTEHRTPLWEVFIRSRNGMSHRHVGSVHAADTELVVCETAIDLLSYAALFGIEGRRFVSTAGALNPEQPALLHRQPAPPFQF